MAVPFVCDHDGCQSRRHHCWFGRHHQNGGHGSCGRGLGAHAIGHCGAGTVTAGGVGVIIG